ncbi:hypothetical protein [Labrys wisconsinensis]|uniref:Uncharacterized protein n=1 Tax=Labrys wisconsinensis TaxID=425677 RepID=A0ABU0J9U5_9HYPH|nr:hypothetical protein [Labrys wisconsinensis]MDQ0469952.1 hypothetical protein [Labrys wisconsinensis]
MAKGSVDVAAAILAAAIIQTTDRDKLLDPARDAVRLFRQVRKRLQRALEDEAEKDRVETVFKEAI